MFPTAVEGEIEITWRNSVDRWGDCSSDKDLSSTKDVDEDTDDLPGDCALMAVDSNENITAL